ncbi:MAG: hypothetical protein MUE71_11160 [Chitinophagaceae bacterium]|nr:hypothetical protein [Chitinophagaceae bacterium]
MYRNTASMVSSAPRGEPGMVINKVSPAKPAIHCLSEAWSYCCRTHLPEAAFGMYICKIYRHLLFENDNTSEHAT